MGCSKCLKIFPTEKFGDKPNYSGFKKTEQEPRSHALHVWYAYKQRNARTLEQTREIERSHGARYSCLYNLPYNNAISFCIIDPMHCLFLGIVKLFFLVCGSNKIFLTTNSYKLKQIHLYALLTGAEFLFKQHLDFQALKLISGRVDLAFFTICYKRFASFQRLQLLANFVKVCSLLCKKTVQESEFTQAEELMEQFCTQFEQLYGKESLTPNIHLMFHITDCIRDHGPVYGFWLYAFERMNGISGNFPTSNHEIGIQLM